MIDGDTLVSLDLRLAAEELAVLCRGREAQLRPLLPELAEVAALDVAERTLLARGFVELAPGGSTRLTEFADYLVQALCEPLSLEHVTVDELGGGSGWWEAIAHGAEMAVTVTASGATGVYDLHVTGPFATAPSSDRDASTLQTTLARLEELLAARRAGTLDPDPGDTAGALVYGAATYAQRVSRVLDGATLAVAHRTILDAADLGTWELLDVPSPVEGDDVDADATITWVRLPDHDEEDDE